MISSCRRTRRWLAPYPPGRSHTASLSFRIHAKFRGWMPWAHFPFIGTCDAPSCCVLRDVAADDQGGVSGGPHVVRAHHRGAARHGPRGGGERALQAVVDRGRLGLPVGRAEERAEEPLATGADQHGEAGG